MEPIKVFFTLQQAKEVQRIMILDSEKQRPKDVFFLRKLLMDWQLNLLTAASASNLCERTLIM